MTCTKLMTRSTLQCIFFLSLSTLLAICPVQVHAEPAEPPTDELRPVEEIPVTIVDSGAGETSESSSKDTTVSKSAQGESKVIPIATTRKSTKQQEDSDSGSDDYAEDAAVLTTEVKPLELPEFKPLEIRAEESTKRSSVKLSVKSTPETVITPELAQLRDRIRYCLAHYYMQFESVHDHSPWGIMHSFIAYGVETQVIVNDRRVNACGYLCWNGPCRGMQMMGLDGDKLGMRIGPGVQGHPGQFLAMLAQAKVKRDYPIRVGERDFTIEDLIACEKATCWPKTELTFKLIGLSHYLDTNDTWKTTDGAEWSISRLLKEEMAQPVIDAACGGTHRLTGLTYALRKRERMELPIDGEYLRARKYLSDYHDYTFSLQNSDGSFSCEWFRGRGDWGDAKRRLETTGHTLEWLVVSLPQEDLTNPRMVAAANFLARLLMTPQEEEWAIGPKGHALHALALYDERVFGMVPGNRAAIYTTLATNGRIRW